MTKAEIVTSGKRAFLIQSTWNLFHDGAVYWDPEKEWCSAEEVLEGGYYYYPGWNAPHFQGKQFPRIRTGDRVVVYFTKTDWGRYSMQIPFVYEVTGVENVTKEQCEKAIKGGWCVPEEAAFELDHPRILRLKCIHTLDPPMSRDQIDALVEKGELSYYMKNQCGRAGFNLCEIKPSDIDVFLNRGEVDYGVE